MSPLTFLQVIFHVASLLSPDERRQFMGNDKVLIYLCEEAQKPLVPRFRGEVNSVGIVVAKRASGWKMACFVRERVAFSPAFPGTALTALQLREYVLATCVDAQTAVMRSPPYADMVGRVVQDMLRQVIPVSDVVKPATATGHKRTASRKVDPLTSSK